MKAIQKSSSVTFLATDNLEFRERNLLSNEPGEPIFEASLQLASLKTVHQRARNSLLALGALIVGVGLFLYFLLEVGFKMFATINGSVVK